MILMRLWKPSFHAYSRENENKCKCEIVVLFFINDCDENQSLRNTGVGSSYGQ